MKKLGRSFILGAAFGFGAIHRYIPVPAPSYDYTVTSAAELDTLLNTTLANDNDLSGKVIGLAPANYGGLTIANRNPASPVTLVGTVCPVGQSGISG